MLIERRENGVFVIKEDAEVEIKTDEPIQLYQLLRTCVPHAYRVFADSNGMPRIGRKSPSLIQFFEYLRSVSSTFEDLIQGVYKV